MTTTGRRGLRTPRVAARLLLPFVRERDQHPRPWGPEESNALREQLIPDLAQLTSEDDTADWSTRTCRRRIRLSLQTPNSWRRASARGLGSSSNSLRNPRNRARQVTKPPSPEVGLLSSLPLKPVAMPQKLPIRGRRPAKKTIRLRDKEHGKFVATQPCVSEAARQPRPNISALPSHGRSVVKSAMNLRSPFAASTTAIFTITAMRPHGGPALTSIPCPSRSNFGGGRARPKSRDVVIAAHQGSQRWMRPRRGHVPASQSALLTWLSAGL